MNKESADKSREHLANERTFLAWVRTGLAFIGLGFVIVKFGLFMKQVAVLLEGKLVLPVKGYSTGIGVVMVAVGIVLAAFSFLQYRRTGKQIDNNEYMPSSLLPLLLTLTILIGGVVLIIYLMPGLSAF
ncbi:MAG: YidH family protein [Mangrovibacterium sp.]